MDGDDHSSQMEYQHCSSRLNSRPMTMGSVYGGSGLDSVVSLNQAGDFAGVVTSVVSQTQEISCSDLNFANVLPKLPMFVGDGSFRDFVHPFGHPGGGLQGFNATFTQNNGLNLNGINGKTSPNDVQVDGDCCVSEGRSVGVSLDGKRKREIDASSSLHKNTEGEPQKEHSKQTSGSKSDGKRQKTEQNSAGNSPAKQAGKQVKENSQDEESLKQNYIHVRARRGQATNSHSLAERVRREKISERMRLLQELVPGCNKITGKAVMLDEIINYVQSLQQQVEFLSMKLATVNPELNFDIERLLSKDIFHPRGNTTPLLGFDHGMSRSLGLTPGVHQGILATLPNAAPQYHLPQVVWDSDLQNLLDMGFDSNHAVGSLGQNGSSKGEI